VEGDGTVSLVPSNNGTPVYHGAQEVFKFSKEGKKSKFNGLAIGANGEVAWAFNKGDSKKDKVGIYRWDTAKSEGERVLLSELPDGEFGSPNISSLVAGGVNPSDPTGEYYFGGFVQEKKGTYFTTYKYSGGRIVLVGAAAGSAGGVADGCLDVGGRRHGVRVLRCGAVGRYFVENCSRLSVWR